MHCLVQLQECKSIGHTGYYDSMIKGTCTCTIINYHVQFSD